MKMKTSKPSLTSPLKLMWIPGQELEEQKPTSDMLKDYKHFPTSSESKVNALNAITVAVQELDIKSDTFKRVSLIFFLILEVKICNFILSRY